jgi:hypothetical protein
MAGEPHRGKPADGELLDKRPAGYDAEPVA